MTPAQPLTVEAARRLLQPLEAWGPELPDGLLLEGVTNDARRCGPGLAFAAYAGTRVDGHTFLAQAAERGAPLALVRAGWRPEVEVPLPCWVVPRPELAAAELAAALHGHPAEAVPCLAVTGTNGKTTTAWLAAQLLSACGLPAASLGTLGLALGSRISPTGFTTPQGPELQACLASAIAEGAQAVVMEASSHAIHQRRLWAVPFRAAAFTNLSQDHLDYHGTMEAYLAAKAELFTAHATGQAPALAVVNLDDEAGRQLASGLPAQQVVGYGLEPAHRPALLATELEEALEGARFTVVAPEGRFPTRLPLAGRYNVANALAALGLARALGLPLAQLCEALPRVAGVPGRVERVSPEGHPFVVWVDYAHTPDGLRQVLSAGRALNPRRLIVAFGAGGDRDRTKRPLMGQAAAALADEVVLTSDNPRSEDPASILREVALGAPQARLVVDRAQGIAEAIALAGPGDLVVIAGKGHEATQTFADRTLPFDDREVARQALAQAGA